MRYVLLATLLVAPCALAQAAPCPIGTEVCPAFTACVNPWPVPTTREDGSALPTSEIAGYELTLDAKVVQTGSANGFHYPVPKGQTLTTASVWGLKTIDTAGNKSTTATTCSQPTTVRGPVAPPTAAKFTTTP